MTSIRTLSRHHRLPRLLFVLPLRALLLVSVFLALTPGEAAVQAWSSPSLGRDLTYDLLEPTSTPADEPAGVPLVIYLTGLASPRVGTESDLDILRDLRADGFLVMVLDYAHAPGAHAVGLTRDLVALRRQLQQHTLLSGRAIDPNQVFIVPSGHRLRRNVVYYRDADRTLAMDLIYPSKPRNGVGAVLEFSCDNANRMGNFSLDFCTDTLLPGAAIEGHAVAMADHPVAAPYQGLDAMPDSAVKIKAAVRTLRAEGAALGLNGRIVPLGFSRGSGMALMLATTEGHPEFPTFGEHPETDSGVQGAVVMSGRFTYLDLLPDDAMILRYTQAWGPRATHEAVWRQHGALDYLNPAPDRPPYFLTINVSEGRDALHQMEVLRQRLTTANHPFEYFPERGPRGHKMPISPDVLKPLYRYLQGQLTHPQPEESATHARP